jgi:hypothetical protein
VPGGSVFAEDPYKKPQQKVDSGEAFVVGIYLFGRFEFIDANAAVRAYPVFGQIGKCGSGSNAVVGVTQFRIIDIVA